MKKKIINFIPIIGIYFCFKYYFRDGKRTIIEFFDSEDMVLYHFFITILMMFLYAFIYKI